jgi:hypothetical protein
MALLLAATDGVPPADGVQDTRAWSTPEANCGAVPCICLRRPSHDKVNLSKQFQSLFHRHTLRCQALRELPQDPAHFALFFRLDVEQLVVQLHHAIRLNVHCGTASGFPVHNTPQRLTKFGLQRNHKALITNRHYKILHHAAIRSHEVVEGPMHAISHTFEALADIL